MGRKKSNLTKEECKEAKRLYNKERYKNNPESQKQANKKWVRANKEKVKKGLAKWRGENKEKIKDYDKDYRKINKGKLKENNREVRKIYVKNNRKTINEKVKERRNTDNIFRLTSNLRSLISKSFKNKGFKKNSKTVNILGCLIDEFKQYIESLWEPWMNWDNYGNPKDGIVELNKTWDIDHIIPVSTAKTEEDLIRLNHYTNLKPLCSYNNRYVKRDNKYGK